MINMKLKLKLLQILHWLDKTQKTKKIKKKAQEIIKITLNNTINIMNQNNNQLIIKNFMGNNRQITYNQIFINKINNLIICKVKILANKFLVNINKIFNKMIPNHLRKILFMMKVKFTKNLQNRIWKNKEMKE